MSADAAAQVFPMHYGSLDHSEPCRVTSPHAGGANVTGPGRATGLTFTDQQIVAGLRQGEAWAADQLYLRVHGAVQRTLRRTLRYGDWELEDLMQESFERMLRVLAKKPLGGACNLPAWASAVTAHVALDRLRKRTRERRVLSRDAAIDREGDGPGLERGLEARSRLARVQVTLGRMRPQYAEALLLHDVLGHDLAEIAEMTGTSVSAAQSRLVRGRKDFQRRAGGKVDR